MLAQPYSNEPMASNWFAGRKYGYWKANETLVNNKLLNRKRNNKKEKFTTLPPYGIHIRGYMYGTLTVPYVRRKLAECNTTRHHVYRSRYS